MARTSASLGTLRRTSGSAVSSDAAISFNAAFLAPLTGMAPDRRAPPRMRIRSMIPRNRAGRPENDACSVADAAATDGKL